MRLASGADPVQRRKARLKLQLAEKYQEVFACLFLDNQHRVIEYSELFFGTIDAASVHPREVVRGAINHNAAAVILAQNHPSGVAEPSRADTQITRRLHDDSGYIAITTTATAHEVLEHFTRCTVIEQVAVDAVQMPHVVRGMVTATGVLMRQNSLTRVNL